MNTKFKNSKANRYHHRYGRNRAGMITWGTLMASMFLMILVSLVSNTAITVNRKMEVQNTADSIAYASSVWVARGMNSVTATNHVIGELNALYVIHHAMGGKYLDDHSSDRRRNNGDFRLTFPPFSFGGITFKAVNLVGIDIAFEVAYFGSLVAIGSAIPSRSHKNTVRENPVADFNSMLFESKETLKHQMAAAYALHISGLAQYAKGVAQLSNPFTFAAGLANIAGGISKTRTAKALQTAIYLQYVVLNQVETFALSTSAVKVRIPDLIQIIHVYQRASVALEIPGKALFAANELADRVTMDGYTLGDLPDAIPDSIGSALDELSKILPKMPVERENITNEERSQMLRATFPWVRHWRKNIVLALLLAPTSTASLAYRKWTHLYAKEASQWLRTDTDERYSADLTVTNRRSGGRGENGKDVRMFVMLDLNEDGEKSREDWNQPGVLGSTRADEIFCVMGFAKSAKPKMISGRFFRQENPHGIICYSQAMIYNANFQESPRSSGDDQLKVGWDTLGWDPDERRVEEWKKKGFGFLGSRPISLTFILDFEPFSPPRVKLNWQAKLTPLTVHKMLKTLPAIALVDEEIGQIIINNQFEQAPLQNH